MANGMIRKIDQLGRIVIPKEMCRELSLETGSKVQIDSVPGGILLSPLNASCVICGGTDGLIVDDGIAICQSCLDRYNRKVTE